MKSQTCASVVATVTRAASTTSATGSTVVTKSSNSSQSAKVADYLKGALFKVQELSNYIGRAKTQFSDIAKSNLVKTAKNLPVAKKPVNVAVNPSPSDQAPTSVPNWKLKKRVSINQETIDSRTRYVLKALQKPTSQSSLHARLEDFCSHVYQFPHAKCLAVREGAISLLLKLADRSREEASLRLIREGLALVGYTGPPKGAGIRILSIDGGGTRGLLAIRMLRRMEEIAQTPIHKCFDYICGVSTGAIISYLIGVQKKSLAECEVLYRQMSCEVFRQYVSYGLGGLLRSHAYYDTEKWERILQDIFGENPLIYNARDNNSPKVSAVSTVVNQDSARAYVFRTYNLPYRVQSQYSGSSRHKVWEAVRASAAAPGYFREFKLEDHLHQDGGLLVNNPGAVAIHEARQLWPDEKLQCVVSVGTGRCWPTDVSETMGLDVLNTSLKQKLVKVLDSATDTERVHAVLHDLLPPRVYYRFNPYLSEVAGLDETEPAKWNLMLEDTDMYMRKNSEKLKHATRRLLQPRNPWRQFTDWADKQRQMIRSQA